MEHMTIIEDALKSMESREEALKIVLSISTDPDSLKLISDCKNIIRLVIESAVDDKTSNLGLQVMINLSQNKPISEIMVKNGAFNTLFDYLSKLTNLFPLYS